MGCGLCCVLGFAEVCELAFRLPVDWGSLKTDGLLMGLNIGCAFRLPLPSARLFKPMPLFARAECPGFGVLFAILAVNKLGGVFGVVFQRFGGE